MKYQICQQQKELKVAVVVSTVMRGREYQAQVCKDCELDKFAIIEVATGIRTLAPENYNVIFKK